MSALRLIAALLWQALVIRFSVELLSDISSAKRRRCTWITAFYSALVMAAPDVVGMMLVGIMPLGLVLSWLIRFAVALVLFHWHFGLSRVRAIAMVPLLVVAAFVWRSFVEPILPLL